MIYYYPISSLTVPWTEGLRKIRRHKRDASTTKQLEQKPNGSDGSRDPKWREKDRACDCASGWLPMESHFQLRSTPLIDACKEKHTWQEGACTTWGPQSLPEDLKKPKATLTANDIPNERKANQPFTKDCVEESSRGAGLDWGAFELPAEPLPCCWWSQGRAVVWLARRRGGLPKLCAVSAPSAMTSKESSGNTSISLRRFWLSVNL